MKMCRSTLKDDKNAMRERSSKASRCEQGGSKGCDMRAIQRRYIYPRLWHSCQCVGSPFSGREKCPHVIDVTCVYLLLSNDLMLTWSALTYAPSTLAGLFVEQDKMIALPSPLLAQEPSPSARQAAQQAASNQHGLINLIRLVKSLEAKVASEGDEDVETWALKRDWETVLYARALLDALQGGNEQSSSTSSTLNELDQSLTYIESSYRSRLSSPLPTPPLNPALIALPTSPSTTNPVSRVSTPLPQPLRSSAVVEGPSTEHKHVPKSRGGEPSSGSVRKRRIQIETDQYLSQRAREDLTGQETGLLPLVGLHQDHRSANPKSASDREKLLGDGLGAAVGSAQLHEELGGQLVDMSHRLKLNAIHFATSLENEKTMLEDSGEVLEKNLAATRSSKKTLSSVSKKGRGTTCLTLGVVILVLVLFVWTYMLIRFT
ncbi:hypothetical protein IAR55_001883 [Kwoniella newhampshirensis]|uniref:SWIM-type domain-containing protein n=1 Tax=Kwoniella newhampshirensis TaxID=1651941 RepID=A0AAW0Z3A3_9TREE